MKSAKVYLTEYKNTIVRISTTLKKAKDSLKGKESEEILITEFPLDKLVSTEDFKDNLGCLKHWHWDTQYEKRIG